MGDTVLREKIQIDGVDQAVSRMNVLTGAIGRVANAFSGLTAAAGALGGIVGVWQIAESVREVDRLYEAVNRVTSMTEMTAANAHAMFKQFAMGGIELEAAERIMTSMTRSAEKMSDGFGGVGVQAMMVKQLMASIGASVKAGPEERLIAMSKAAKAGKLNIDELIRAFMIPRSQAARMMEMLKQGPDRMKEIAAQTLKSGALIDDQALASYRQMLQNRRELREAWQDIVGVLYKSLLPAVTAILHGIKRGFDAITPVADTIGRVLKTHMEAVVKQTKTYLELMLAAKVANLVTGTQMGILGRGRQVVGGAIGFLNKGRAAGAAADYFEAKAMSPGVGMFEKAGAGPLTVLFGALGRIGPFLTGLVSSAGALLPALAGLLPILGVLAAVVAIVVVAIEMLKNNTWGLATMFKKTLGSTLSALGSAFHSIVEVLGLLWSAIKPLVMLVAGALLLQLWWFAKTIELIAHVIKWAVDMIVAVINAVLWLLNKIPGVNIKLLGEAQKSAEDKADVGGNKAGATTYQDFRGSKFEITNNFPTGIDGGRVAVAFGDDLARLGERRLDSGLRPLYSYR
jgi:hypothetical protein